MHSRRFIALVWIGFAQILTAGVGHTTNESEITVFQLRYRNATDLIPLLQPVIDKDVKLAGQGHQLIVRASASQLDTLRQVIEQLDRTPAQFTVFVSQDDGTQSNAGSARVIDSQKNDVELRIRRTDSRRDDLTVQHLQLMEGETAFISTGQDIPVAGLSQSVGPHGLSTAVTIGYQPVETGFKVIARAIDDDQVALTITPIAQNLDPSGGGIINHSAAQSTLTVPLNTWVSVAGIQQSTIDQQDAVVHRTDGRNQQQRTIRIKVVRHNLP